MVPLTSLLLLLALAPLTIDRDPGLVVQVEAELTTAPSEVPLAPWSFGSEAAVEPDEEETSDTNDLMVVSPTSGSAQPARTITLPRSERVSAPDEPHPSRSPRSPPGAVAAV